MQEVASTHSNRYALSIYEARPTGTTVSDASCLWSSCVLECTFRDIVHIHSYYLFNHLQRMLAFASSKASSSRCEHAV